MPSEMSDLTRRGITAYYRQGGRKWVDPSSGDRVMKGLKYVVLESDGKTLAVYRVRKDTETLRRLRRWPFELTGSDWRDLRR